MKLIFDEIMFGEFKDENYELRHKGVFVKIANEFQSFPLFVSGGLVESTSGDKRSFIKEPEFYPVKCCSVLSLKAYFSRQ